jgi:hypothetical protein
MPVLDEIAAKLAALGVGTVGTTIFTGYMPETPDECCCVYEYGGTGPEMGFGSPGIHYERPSVQVVFRGPTPGPGVTTSYSGPRALAETAYRGLAEVEATTLSGTFYHTVIPQQAPFLMKRDDAKRVYIAFNAVATKELSAA